jgi:hypothetical protein
MAPIAPTKARALVFLFAQPLGLAGPWLVIEMLIGKNAGLVSNLTWFVNLYVGVSQ